MTPTGFRNMQLRLILTVIYTFILSHTQYNIKYYNNFKLHINKKHLDVFFIEIYYT